MNPTPKQVIEALGGSGRAAELLYGSAKRQNRVSNWLHPKRNKIPAEDSVMRVIEAHTPFTRYDVRPDVYGDAPAKRRPSHSREEAA